MPTSDKIEYKYVTRHFTHEATYTNHTIFKSTKYAKKSVTQTMQKTKEGSGTQKMCF